MKNLMFVCIAILFSVAAQSQDVMSYSTTLIDQSNAGRYCPELSKITAVNQRSSLEGLEVIFNYRSGEKTRFAFEHATTQCISDMVCITSNIYSSPNSNMYLLLERNNDGQYPTADRPGYKTMEVVIKAQEYPNWPRCTYLLHN